MTDSSIFHPQTLARQTPIALPGEAVFAIDDKRCIVLWSPAAEAILGFSESEVLGHHCWEVLQGSDVFGRLLPCHICQGCLQGEIVNLAQRQFFIKRKDGRPVRLSHEFILLPDSLGAKALILLKTSSQSDNTLPVDSSSRSYWWDMVKGLATLGVIAHEATARDLGQSLDLSLERVLSITGADAAELFLYHHPSREMFLTAHRGLFRAAFYQITRFKLGEGYPGLVAASGEPLITLDVGKDPRYLRTRVKEKGIQFYLCLPLQTKQGVIGSLNIASRRHDRDPQSQLHFLTGVAETLSSAVELTWLRSQQTLDSLEPDEAWGKSADPAPDLERALRHIVLVIVAAAQAQGGRAILYDVDSGAILRKFDQGNHCLGSCGLLRNGQSGFARCPVLATGRASTLSRNQSQPESSCGGILGETSAALCLPLSNSGKSFGVITLAYSERQKLLTRHLALLGTMADRAARMLWPLYCRLWRAECLSSNSAPASLDHPEVSPLALTEARPYLDIRCLGGFQVYREGRLLTPAHFGRRQALAVFKVLIAHRGRPVSPDFLMECLWPEVNPDSAKRGLWVAVHCLRKALEPAKDKKSSIILTNGESYYFNTEASYWLDVEELLKEMRRAEELESQEKPEKALESYKGAAQLYRGDFLEDEPYSDWCAAEREYLREVYLSLLKRIALLYEAKKDYERAALYYRSALARDPLREELHRQLMSCLWRAGRRGEALRQYQECRNVLAKELGVEPLEETRSLYQQIMGEYETIHFPKT